MAALADIVIIASFPFLVALWWAIVVEDKDE